MTSGQDFHPADPRRLAREAMADGKTSEARAWAELATAEALHRLAKVVGREYETPSGPVPLERGRSRRAGDNPDSTEQAA